MKSIRAASRLLFLFSLFGLASACSDMATVLVFSIEREPYAVDLIGADNECVLTDEGVCEQVEVPLETARVIITVSRPLEKMPMTPLDYSLDLPVDGQNERFYHRTVVSNDWAGPVEIVGEGLDQTGATIASTGVLAVEIIKNVTVAIEMTLIHVSQ